MEQTETSFDMWLDNINKMMDGCKTVTQWTGETSGTNGGFYFGKAPKQWTDNCQAMLQGIPFHSVVLLTSLAMIPPYDAFLIYSYSSLLIAPQAL